MKYLGNGIFSNEELIDSTKIVDDEIYSYKFDDCR